jgi:hypothetical protein
MVKIGDLDSFPNHVKDFDRRKLSSKFPEGLWFYLNICSFMPETIHKGAPEVIFHK